MLPTRDAFRLTHGLIFVAKLPLDTLNTSGEFDDDPAQVSMWTETLDQGRIGWAPCQVSVVSGDVYGSKTCIIGQECWTRTRSLITS
jgi:hypothetical protein